MNADKWVHPTKFTGDYPSGWAGFTFCDWDATNKVYHPGDDYNFGEGGDSDLGQDAVATSAGIVFHKSLSTTGYGNLLILKHTLGYNIKRFIKDKYGIETDTLYTLYGHLKDIVVKEGDEVTTGQLVGHVGKSGTQWAHLHCEIYSLWKDLKNTSYRFYPIGWSKEQVQQNYLPAYFFIEASKNLEEVSFLGKSKEYWLTVESDRTNLMAQLGVKEQEILKIKQGLQEQIDSLTLKIQQLEVESAKNTSDYSKSLESIKLEVTDLQKKLATASEQINTLKNEKAILLAEQAEKYKTYDAWVLFIQTIIKKLRGVK